MHHFVNKGIGFPPNFTCVLAANDSVQQYSFTTWNATEFAQLSRTVEPGAELMITKSIREQVVPGVLSELVMLFCFKTPDGNDTALEFPHTTKCWPCVAPPPPATPVAWMAWFTLAAIAVGGILVMCVGSLAFDLILTWLHLKLFGTSRLKRS